MTDAAMKYRLQKNADYGFFQVSPTPSAEDITRFYADEFYSGQYRGFNNSALEVQLKDPEFHQAHWNDMAETIEQLSGRSLKGQRILDVGCGWAQALSYFSGKGALCYGFDPAPEAVEYASRRGLNVRRAGMETMNVFPGEKFDVVTLMNVLEHLSDPVSVMKEIRSSVLNPGGILVIEVPNEFNAFQVCGQKVHQLPEWWVAPPAHLNYFSNDSLRNLLSGTGYSVLRTEASFPMEMFLLFGENYVANKDAGRECHARRMAFEKNLRANGYEETLRRFYEVLAQENLGRQITAYAFAGEKTKK